MASSILVLFLLPWLDTSQVRSARFRPVFQPFFSVVGRCGATRVRSDYRDLSPRCRLRTPSPSFSIVPATSWPEDDRHADAALVRSETAHASALAQCKIRGALLEFDSDFAEVNTACQIRERFLRLRERKRLIDYGS